MGNPLQKKGDKSDNPHGYALSGLFN